jgi:hypothetical protein
MSISLQLQNNEITGEFALKIPPGTLAAKRDKLLDEQLTDPLFNLAQEQKLVLAAEPHDFARPLDGLNEQGETRFQVSGRIEAGRILPIRRSPSRKR